MSKQQTEINYLKNQIKEVRQDVANLIIALIELKVLPIYKNPDGTVVYGTKEDDDESVQ